MIYIDNDWGDYDYITHIYVSGMTVFCIEPRVLFTAGNAYEEDYTAWDSLSEWQRQAIWEINYYGYSYPGHQTGGYYIATQVMIWEVVCGEWFTPYELDGSTPIGISCEVSTISSLRSNPQGRPSFANSTVKTGLNIPMTFTDTKGTLSQYTIHSGKGVNVSADGNTMTVSITSEDYDKSITFSKNYSARDCNIIYGAPGKQKVIYLATRSDPTTNFKLNFELLYADVEVEKQDKETDNETQGDATFDKAEFEIRNSEGDVLDTFSTNGSKGKSKKFPVGTTVYVYEKNPPVGYNPNEEGVEVELTFSGDSTPKTFSTVYKDQVIKGRIEIAKTVDQEREYPTDSVISVPGVGFIFDVYLKSSGELVTTLTTNEEGRAMSELLPYGTYQVIEREKEGFDLLEPFEVFISEEGKVYFFNIYNDTFRAEINIYKTDTETGKRIPAADVRFKIKDSEGNFVEHTVMYPTKYVTDVFVTDENGSVHLPEPLDYGKYSIVEINAPYGYVLRDSEIELNVDGSSTEIFIPFDNKAQKGKIIVEKYGEMLSSATTEDSEYGPVYSPVYSNRYLEGVTFDVRAKEDIVGQEGTKWYSKGDLVGTIITDSAGIAESKLLPLGNYEVKETETVKGFILDETIQDVEIEYAGQLVEVVPVDLLLNNKRQTFNIEINKLFEDNDKEAYKDVVFGIYAGQDYVVDAETVSPSDSLVGLITLDEDGKNVEQYDLPCGKYYLKELKTNDGFVLDEEKHEFVLEYSDDTAEEVVIIKVDGITNEKRRLDLEVIKVDKADHNILLNGAVFEVTDKTADKNLGILVTGRFAIKGSAKKEEWEVSTTEDFSTILTTAKTDSECEIILSLSEGTYYARKIDTDRVIKVIVANGKAVLPDAVYGHEYEFKEIEAPSSYVINRTPGLYTVIADVDVNTVSFEFENSRIVVPNTSINK